MLGRRSQQSAKQTDWSEVTTLYDLASDLAHDMLRVDIGIAHEMLRDAARVFKRN